MVLGQLGGYFENVDNNVTFQAGLTQCKFSGTHLLNIHEASEGSTTTVINKCAITWSGGARIQFKARYNRTVGWSSGTVYINIYNNNGTLNTQYPIKYSVDNDSTPQTYNQDITVSKGQFIEVQVHVKTHTHTGYEAYLYDFYFGCTAIYNNL